MVEQKEIEEFVIRFGGAMKGALESAATEGYFKAHPEAHGKFPYTQLHPNLCPNDNLLVAGLAIPLWVIGALAEEDGKKKGDIKARELGKNVEMFGEGDVIYSGNLALHHSLIRTISNTWPTVNTFPLERSVGGSRRKTGGSPAGGSPGQRTDVGHRIIKL